jgi:uncharacterized protein (TIGR02147 family)
MIAKPENPSRPNVYQYDDFRAFLRDVFAFMKSEEAGFSHRKFARSAGIANPGYLLDVTLGKRPLSRNQGLKMAPVFGLNEQETEFFLLLAEFGQSKKDVERQALYQDLLLRRNRSRFARLSPSLVKYYQDYRYSLVRCAVEALDFRGDFEALGKFLDPPLAPALARKCVQDLLEWGLIVKDEGRYRVTEKFVEPPPTLSAMVRRLNREWILQAAEVPFKFGPADRHVSALLLMVSEKTRAQLMDKVEAFRKEVLDLVEKDSSPETIMQLSIQLFPKSRRSLGASRGGKAHS